MQSDDDACDVVTAAVATELITQGIQSGRNCHLIQLNWVAVPCSPVRLVDWVAHTMMFAIWAAHLFMLLMIRWGLRGLQLHQSKRAQHRLSNPSPNKIKSISRWAGISKAQPKSSKWKWITILYINTIRQNELLSDSLSYTHKFTKKNAKEKLLLLKCFFNVLINQKVRYM